MRFNTFLIKYVLLLAPTALLWVFLSLHHREIYTYLAAGSGLYSMTLIYGTIVVASFAAGVILWMLTILLFRRKRSYLVLVFRCLLFVFLGTCLYSGILTFDLYIQSL